MFEARLVQGATLKKILDALKDLVGEANFDCKKDGFSMQAMDSSHVALIALKLEDKAFDEDSYRCDRAMTLGMNLVSVSKMLKCANNEDIITMKAEDNPDLINFMFESPNGDRVSDFELKLMQIDSETLGIPDSDYDARIKMPSAEFKRIASDLGSIGDTITLSVTKDGVKFSTLGDIGNANVLVKQTSAVDEKTTETVIDMKEPVTLGFAARYFNSFAKATPLSEDVTLAIHKELPLLVEYPVRDENKSQVGYVRYYLAPKIDDEDNDE